MGWTNIPVAAGSSVAAQVQANAQAAADAVAAAAAADAKAMAAQTMTATADAKAEARVLKAGDTMSGALMLKDVPLGYQSVTIEGTRVGMEFRDTDHTTPNRGHSRLDVNSGVTFLARINDDYSWGGAMARFDHDSLNVTFGDAPGTRHAGHLNAGGFSVNGTKVAGYVALGAALTVHTGSLLFTGHTLAVPGMPTTASAVHVVVERTGFSGSRDGLPILAGPLDNSPLTTGGELPQLATGDHPTRLEMTVRNNPGTNQFFIKTLEFFTSANVHVLGYWL